MAEKPVIWSNREKKSRLEILKYWKERNGTTTYSEKLFGQFRNVAWLIGANPWGGRPTTFGKV